MTRLFGTDGVRGVANLDLTPELAFAIGRAGAAVLAGDAAADKPIVVGRDTRVSGSMLEAAIVAGITSTGRNVLALGIVPTPAVAAVTVRVGAAAGVMISASHNPVEDNGIKFFGPDGFKLSDTLEDRIDATRGSANLPRPTHLDVGVAHAARGLIDRYMMLVVDAGADMTGWTIVIDAANGAAAHIAPEIFRQLGARVVPINVEDDGRRINVNCGATDLRMLQARVLEEAASAPGPLAGVAFDGDADRAKFVDECGDVLDGDHVLFVLARDRKARGALAGNTIVSTVMSNIGLERALEREGITMLRAAVGDRYVLERMRSGGYPLGGEQSGHVIDLDRNTTGDGPMTAVALFRIAVQNRATLRELASGMTVYPQILINIKADRRLAEHADVVRAVAAAQSGLGGGGRILVRPSGTEPLVRVMVEAGDRATTDRVANDLANIVRALDRNLHESSDHIVDASEGKQ